MDQTAQWPAVRQLRAWEREQLALQPGAVVLDAGCGAGDVTVEMASVVGPAGRAVGLDVSEQMLAEARRRAEQRGVTLELVTGSLSHLEFDDNTFDATRSERTLQWVEDADAAFAELVRVTRPGGRVVVIESDWRTMQADFPEPELFARFFEAVAAVRPASMWVGGRLVNMARDAGLRDVDATAAAHLWLRWDPDTEPGPSGFFPLRYVAADLAEQGRLDRADADRFLSLAEDAGRQGSLQHVADDGCRDRCCGLGLTRPRTGPSSRGLRAPGCGSGRHSGPGSR